MPYPPLVAPAEDLTPDQARRYVRQLTLPDVGPLGQRRLRAARILVVGAGGLGSPVLLYLAAAGVGTLGIVDDDAVDVTNLHRQVVHGDADLGRPKVDSARDRVLASNPEVEVRSHRVRLTAANALDVIAGYDLVVDGTDNFATRYLVGDACAILGTPVVWGSILRMDAQVSVFWAGQGPTYRDLFPVPPPPDAVPSCAEGGVLGAVCGVVGSVMATEAVKLVTGTGEPLVGRVLVLDAAEMTWRTVRVRRNPDLPPVTTLTDLDQAYCSVASGPPAVTVTPAAGAGQRAGATEVTATEVTATELARMLAARERGEDDFVLVDVREPFERDIVAIPGSVALPLDRFRSGEALTDLPAERRVVLHCKSGRRSAEALSVLHAAGRSDAVHLAGGILAWVADVEPGKPVY